MIILDCIIDCCFPKSSPFVLRVSPVGVQCSHLQWRVASDGHERWGHERWGHASPALCLQENCKITQVFFVIFTDIMIRALKSVAFVLIYVTLIRQLDILYTWVVGQNKAKA